jgi:hypothetical protein
MQLIYRHEQLAIWPLSLPTEHGSHYFHTPEAGGPVDRKSSAQVGCALAQLGWNTPQAISCGHAVSQMKSPWLGGIGS